MRIDQRVYPVVIECQMSNEVVEHPAYDRGAVNDRRGVGSVDIEHPDYVYVTRKPAHGENDHNENHGLDGTQLGLMRITGRSRGALAQQSQH